MRVEPDGPALDRGFEQHLLAAEVIVDERDVGMRLRRDHAVRRLGEAVRRDQRLRGVEQRVAGGRAAQGCRSQSDGFHEVPL